MESDNYKVDMKKAELLRSYYETGKLTDTAMVQILSGEKTRKPKSNKPQSFKVKPAVISKYFTNEQSQKEIEDTIDKALPIPFDNPVVTEIEHEDTNVGDDTDNGITDKESDHSDNGSFRWNAYLQVCTYSE